MTYKSEYIILIILSLIIMTSCSTFHAPTYVGSIENVIAIKDKSEGSKNYVRINDFKAASTVNQKLMCRAAGPVKPSTGDTFQKYIEDALRDELFKAGIYNSAAKVQIDGLLKRIHFESMGSSSWDIELELSSTTGTSYTVSILYEFSGSWTATHACRDGAEALVGAVQALILKVIEHPDFNKLIGA